uniref:ABC transporter n=1 Tax=Candidatus Kentrum sp. SD TaxID=2126332 RepID=A0A451BRQ1_9GAMM|nr:MAG: ABC transporter [Candidatus Kentron sp. SD]
MSNNNHRSAIALLLAEGIQKSFGGQTVLHGLDLELSQGEVALLRGENGSGKTTLLNILTGNLEPDAGTGQYPYRKNKNPGQTGTRVKPPPFGPWREALTGSLPVKPRAPTVSRAAGGKTSIPSITSRPSPSPARVFHAPGRTFGYSMPSSYATTSPSPSRGTPAKTRFLPCLPRAFPRAGRRRSTEMPTPC